MEKLTGFEGMSNIELIDAYTSTFESAGTRRVYGTELLRVNTLFGEKPFKDVSKLDLVKYNQSLATKSDATRQRKHATVRSFFTWLVWAGVIWEDENPAKGTFKKITPHSDIKSKCLLAEEVQTLMDLSHPIARDFAMIMVLSTTGVRISEMINMKWSEMYQAINQETKQLGWFIPVITKGNKLRTVFLREDTVYALARLNGGPINPERPGYVFTRLFDKTVTKLTPEGTRKAIKLIAERAGVKGDFTPHWFRHTFASLSTNNGAPVRDMQAVLGHASIRTTEKYLWSQDVKVANYFPAHFQVPVGDQVYL